MQMEADRMVNLTLTRENVEIERSNFRGTISESGK